MPNKLVCFRLPPDLIDRIDRHAERLRTGTPGAQFSRADAVRVLVTSALDRAEGGERKGRGAR